MVKAAFTWVLILSVSLAWAQHRSVRFEQLTIEDGLPQNMVDCMLQDSRGFYWFGTWNGLAKFDGYSFETFNTEGHVEDGLGENFIYALQEDQYGNIWVGTSRGLFVYLYKERRFREIILSFESKEKRAAYHALDHFNEKFLLLGSKSGASLLSINDPDGSYALLGHVGLDSGPADIKGSIVNTVLSDSHQYLWIGTDNGLFRFNHNLENIKEYRYELEDPWSLSRSAIVSIFEMRSGDIWVGTETGANLYNREHDNFIRFYNDPQNENSLPHNTIMNLNENERGDLLVGTLGGFSIYDLHESRFTNFFYEPNGKHGLSNSFVNCLMVDNKDNVWIGTERGGVNVYSSNQNKFEHYEFEPNNRNSLSHNTVNSIFEDERNIWIGTAGGGLSRYAKSQQKYFHYRSDLNDPGALSSDFVTSINRRRNGDLFIGTWGNGINILKNEGSNREYFDVLYNENTGLQNNFVSDMIEDREGNLWVASLGGISCLKVREKRFQSVHDDNPKIRISAAGCLLIDHQNNLWVGTQTGLFVFEIDGSYYPAPTKFVHSEEDPSTLSGDYVISLNEDSHGNIWVGTYGHGLNKISYVDSGFAISRFGSAQGISNSIIYGIEEDIDQNLWMSTDYGLIQFDPKEVEARTFYQSNGLLNNQYYWSASFRNPQGKLYFGGMNGMDAFYPEWIKNRAEEPSVTITDIKLLNKSVKPGKKYNGQVVITGDASEVQQINLSYLEKAISIEFSALDFLQADVISYSYFLEGFDSKWNDVTSARHFATYTNLVPGNYHFKVRAAGADGSFGNNIKEVSINVLPPFWQTWWFRIAFVASLVGLIIGYTKYRTYTLNAQKEALEKQVLQRTQEINNQKEALSYQAIQLQKNNEVLEHKQELIEGQNKQLEDQNKEILSQRDEVIALNEKLKLVSQLKLSFFTNISHEFRTPLTLIIGPLERLLGNRNLRGEVKETLELMSRNAQRLLHLINEIIEFRKIEKGKIGLKVSEGSFGEFTKAIFNAFKPLASIKEIQFKYAAEEILDAVWYDAKKMENILYNLLSNAFKYTPNGGVIEMRVRQMPWADSRLKTLKPISEPQRVIGVEIRDSGTGISEENLPLIFKRFYRIESENAFKIGGSGIGLAITEELIKTHHGQIFVNSEPGKGSVFEIQFPCLKGNYNSSERQIPSVVDLNIHSQVEVLKNELLVHDDGLDSKEEYVLDSSKETVLVVEDNSDLRKFISLRLSQEYNIVEAGDGERGLQYAEKYNPNLIVSDVMMPKKDGYELCATIKNNFSTCHIPVILLTAKSSVENQIEGLQIGADDYLPKPFNFDLLEVRIKNLIEGRKKLKEQFSKEPDTISVPKYTNSTRDAEFLDKAIKTVEKHLSDTEFGSRELVLSLGISRSMLHKKLAALTNQSATEFINHLRMKKAKELLKKKELNVSEVAYSVGYNDPKYFSRLFSKNFGQSPRQYQEELIRLN